MTAQPSDKFRYANYIGPRNGPRFIGTPDVSAMLQTLGLPEPAQEIIYGGHQHDMLFLDSHGVTLRIGRTDIEDLANPAIMQPLGWVTDKDTGISIVIYPGIQQYASDMDVTSDIRKSHLEAFLRSTDQNNSDMSPENIGIIRIQENDREKNVLIVLDPDNSYVGSKSAATARRREWKAEHEQEGQLPSTLLRGIVGAVPDNGLKSAFLAAFDVHQPLRTMFWQEMERDPGRLRAFWDRCARLLHKPERVLTHAWTQRVNENGITVWSKEERLTENVALYRAWTNNDQDKETKRSGPMRQWDQYVKQLDEDGPESIPPYLLSHRGFIRFASSKAVRILTDMNPALTDDAVFMDSLPVRDGIIAQHASLRLRNDYAFMRDRITMDGKAAAWIGDELRHDEEKFMKLARHRVSVLQYMPEERNDDRDFILRHIAAIPDLYGYITPARQSEEDIASPAFAACGSLIMAAPEAAKKNPVLAAIAVKHTPDVLPGLPDETRLHRGMLLGLFRENPNLMYYADRKILRDIPFMLEVIAANVDCFGLAATHNCFGLAATHNGPDFTRQALAVNPDVAGQYNNFPDDARSDPDLICSACAYALARDQDLPRWPQMAENNIGLMVRLAQLPGMDINRLPITVRSNPHFQSALHNNSAAAQGFSPLSPG